MKRRREILDEGFIGSVITTGLQAIEIIPTVESLVDCATLAFDHQAQGCEQLCAIFPARIERFQGTGDEGFRSGAIKCVFGRGRCVKGVAVQIVRRLQFRFRAALHVDRAMVFVLHPAAQGNEEKITETPAFELDVPRELAVQQIGKEPN